ncbi:hypothetical protein MNBD_IGNAVI01-2665 [hydrothermal vent metagenome]|uniref:TRASH domain-containing protein n=1 Tax=hydrothermal vent metagenome TaxID=652676 RepID=A0A3B1BQC9_9ZZZZ
MAQDPVCEMEVEEDTASEKVLFEGRTYYFCSTLCKVLFEENPEKYIQKINNNINKEFETE